MPAIVAPQFRSPISVAPRSTKADAVHALPWRVWAKRIRARRLLASLHSDQFREAGLDPHVARMEILKPFWRS